MKGGPMQGNSKKVFGLFVSMAFAIGFAADGAKPAGAVSEKAISADADGHCAKGHADCPKGSTHCCKGHAKAGSAKDGSVKGEAKNAEITAGADADCPKSADCPKGAEGSKHGEGMKHKVGEAKAPATAPAVPAALPADAGKSASHPG
ncbi:MAG: hypothetical protein JWP91_2391 [Fibrobacteres bacterium]|nr:hypothetical protein [Fibrobacterota bacterium]